AALDLNNAAEDRYRLELMRVYQSFERPAGNLLGSLRTAKDAGVRAAAYRLTATYPDRQKALPAYPDRNKRKAFQLSLADAVKGLGDYGWELHAEPADGGPPYAESYDPRLQPLVESGGLRDWKVKSGGHDVPVGTYAQVEVGSVQQPGGGALSALAGGV